MATGNRRWPHGHCGDQRVEVACPIYDEELKERIIHILELQFKDNVKARIINDVQDNHYKSNGDKPVRSQMAIYDYLSELEKDDKKTIKNK